MSKASPGTGKHRRAIEDADLEADKAISIAEKAVAKRHALVCENKHYTRRNSTMASSNDGSRRTTVFSKRVMGMLVSLSEDGEVFSRATIDHANQPSVLPNDGNGNRRRRLSDGSIKIV